MIALRFKNYLLARESIDAARGDIAPLHAAHYAETETKYKGHKVAVDYDRMAAFEAAGRMVCFGAREIDSGRLVAYLFYYVNSSAHDGSIVATEDAYYIVPEHRGSGLAKKLLRYSEKRLVELKVDYVFMSSKAPVGGPNIGPFLEAEGYKATAIVFSKRLGA